MGEHYIPQSVLREIQADPTGVPPAVLLQIQKMLTGQGNLCGSGSHNCYDAVMPAESR